MGEILRMKLPPSKGAIHTYFVISDLHSYHLHVPTFEILLKHSASYREKALIINGDLWDLAFMMKKNPANQKWIKRAGGVEEFFIPEFEKESAVVNRILDVLCKHFDKIIYLGGNHDDLRVGEFLETVPFEYHHHFDLKSVLKLNERGVTFIPYGTWLDIGDVTLIHGLYHNKQCHKSHHEDAGKSVIFGHIHKVGIVPFRKRGKTHQAWSLPCMCKLSPAYIRKRSNEWDTGYGILNIDYHGRFNFNLFQIWNNRLILPTGEVLQGD